MAAFATIQDVAALWRPLTAEEQNRVGTLLNVISDSLRVEARRVGKNLDGMVMADAALASVAKSVVVDVVARTMMTPTDNGGMPPMSQMSQSALGYTVSGTYLVPGGGLFIKKSELARLGLRRQKIGVIDLYDNYSARHHC